MVTTLVQRIRSLYFHFSLLLWDQNILRLIIIHHPKLCHIRVIILKVSPLFIVLAPFHHDSAGSIFINFILDNTALLEMRL